jgi:hypothetical protein
VPSGSVSTTFPHSTPGEPDNDHQVGGAGSGCHDDDRQIAASTQGAADVQPVHSRQHQIEQRHVETSRIRRIQLAQRVFARHRRQHLEPLVGKGHPERLLDELVVLGEQHPHVRVHRLPCDAAI